MSVNQYRREVESKSKSRRDAERKTNDYRAKESRKRTEAAKARQAATKTSSPSTARSKLREADRRESEAAAAGNEANRWADKATRYARDEATASERLAKAVATEEKKAERNAQRADRAHQARLNSIEGQVGDMSNLVQDLAGSVEIRQPVEPDDDHLGGQTWDVFLSHASEDKAAIAIPLRDALVARGVTVWLDKTEMKIGSSLRRKIDEGIRSSRFGVVILSKDFLAKGWTNHELDGLVANGISENRQALLPIWHGLTHADVRQYSPSLSDKVALDTASYTVDEISDQIAEVVLDAKAISREAADQEGVVNG